MYRRSFAALALPALTCPAATQDGWVEYRPANAGFRVEFPGRPRVSNRETSTRFGRAHLIAASYEGDDADKFYANYTVYPAAAAAEDSSKLLDSLKLARTVKGKVRAERRFLLAGLPAQRHMIDWQAGTRPVIVAFDVIRTAAVYSIFCIVEYGREDGPVVTRFLDSFAILP